MCAATASSCCWASTTGPPCVINPMLAGRLRYGEPLKKDRVRDALVLRLDDGRELRYHDAEDMGKIYLTLDLGQVPTSWNSALRRTIPISPWTFSSSGCAGIRARSRGF